MVILLGILRVFILYNVVSYVIHFIPLLFLTEPCFFFHEMFRFDHELVIRKKIEEKLIAGREVRLVDRHGILTV